MIVLTGTGGPVIVDIPGGWASVLVALIAAVIGPYVLQARANRRLKRIDQKTDRTLDQVENNHRDPVTGEPINMREENDERHEVVTKQNDKIIALLESHGELLESHDVVLKKLIASQGDQDEDIADSRERLELIERTWPRNRFMPPARHRAPDPTPDSQGDQPL
ncbi:hypothetical protein IT072_03600 [Leifsonia sp. ZF2019]|uniref:hypothetical protein n=1 Tax=Leifsonia sp. ZF2019 TaxID=2781978 RepID=UPI001CBA9509|nr:hypothetical protein [Leifsonia sp. ZF2019]UAJ80143.1 hypothetical protein IT072_03600 [Leifsonia sp. ZF2019]